MTKTTLPLIALVLTAALSACSSAPTAAASTYQTGAEDLRVASLVNEARAQGGDCGGTARTAPALGVNDLVSSAAAAQATDVARTGVASDNGLDASVPVSRVQRAGFPALGAEELVTLGSPEVAVAQWKSSYPACRILFDRTHSRVGVAHVNAQGRTAWVIVLATPTPEGYWDTHPGM